MLFHTVSNDFDGDCLQPCTRITQDGVEGTWLFATNNLLLAACYAIPNGHKHFCSVLDSGTTILLAQKDATENEDLNATVLLLPEETFRPFPGIEEQFISEDAIHVDQAEEHSRIESLDELMRLGVQLFVPEGHVDEFSDIDLVGAGEPLTYIEKLVSENKVRWLNHERNIKPASDITPPERHIASPAAPRPGF